MKILKSFFVGLFWLLIIALMIAPLGLIYQISNAEMAQYATPSAPVLREVAIGGIAQACRTDVHEYVTLSGSFTSDAYAYMELEYKNPGIIRWQVYTGSEVQEGDVLGTYKGEEILSTQTGILVENNAYSADPYLRFQLFTPVEFSCRVEDRTLSILKRNDTLTTEDGETVRLVFASRQKNPDGTTNVRLSIDTDRYTFGQALNELRILSGRVYQKTLVLPAACVYQKNVGEDEPWYARQVTEDGIFVREREVKVGYSNGDVICVTGVEEGEYFDTGYKAIAGG